MWNTFARLRRPGRRAPGAVRPRPARLALEVREDRCLLTTFLVTTNAGGGPGSLPAAVAAAGTGDVITFSDSLAGQPIGLASPLTISKGITILGQGPDKIIISAGN